MRTERYETAAEAAQALGLYSGPLPSDLCDDCRGSGGLAPAWPFLEDEDFVSLCLDGGPALLFTATFTCSANEYELSFAVEILGDGSEFDQPARHDCVIETGDSYWRQEDDLLEIGAARVIGPFRDDTPKGYDFAVEVLKDVMGHLLETAEDFGSDVIDLINDVYPSPESSLEHAVAALRKSNHPLAAYVVERLQRGKPMMV